MTRWQEVSLEEVADDLTVGFVGSMASEYVPSGIPFLRSLNIEPLRVNKNDLKYITPEFHKRISKSKLTTGDVVIVRTGKPGACAVIPDWLSDANCSDLVIVRCGKLINNRFLAYYVNTAASGHVSAHLVGAVQQHFNVGSARTLKMNLPPITEQKAIVVILGALDDKIELNNRMNATLEAAARALFKSWFVDFDPVKAKMAGKQHFGMDAATAALFPAHLTESDLGDIPEGWLVVRLGSIADVNWGDTKTTKASYVETGYPAFSASGQDGFLPHADYARNGIVVSAIGANCGQTWFAQRKWSCIKNTIRLWSTDSDISDEYLYVATNDIRFWPTRGSAQPFISQTDARNCRVLKPANKLADIYGKIVRSNFEVIYQHNIENRTLERTRDYLLPKLISGEIRIPDAEKFVEGLV